jgi:uncharacterized phage-associated protein
MACSSSPAKEGSRVANAIDVSDYILKRKGTVTGYQLHKLLYYVQAWSLVWTGRPLFPEPIEAWENGPVVRRVWEVHRQRYYVDSLPVGDASRLSTAEREIVDAVLSQYGGLSPAKLVKMTHDDEPWVEAWERGHGSGVIRIDLIQRYYSSLPLQDLARNGRLGKLFELQCLLARVTPENVHAEIDTGPPVGAERF